MVKLYFTIISISIYSKSKNDRLFFLFCFLHYHIEETKANSYCPGGRHYISFTRSSEGDLIKIDGKMLIGKCFNGSRENSMSVSIKNKTSRRTR